MAITPGSFRNDFKAFADLNVYPGDGIQFWLNVAGLLLNKDRWGAPSVLPADPHTLYDLGQELFAAHHLTLEMRSTLEGIYGAPPGISTGPVSSKSVDKVSISYATSDAIEPDAGHWNLTIYGTRFARLMRMAGAGPIQVGIGHDPYCGLNGPAWPGPWFSNYPNPSG